MWDLLQNNPDSVVSFYGNGFLAKTSCGFENVKAVDLSSSQLSVIDDGLKRLVNLEQLDVRNNNIKALPSFLNDLKKFSSLEISYVTQLFFSAFQVPYLNSYS